MPEYIPKPDIVIAQKWEGHGQKMDAALKVSVQENAGLSGYYQRMGYFYDHKGTPKTLRPNDYIVKNGKGEVFTMPAAMFEEKYMRNLPNQSKGDAKKAKKVEKKPKVVDTKEDEFEDNLI